MKTKEKIKMKGLELFNTKGVLAVTLRDVAKELGKSYGNVTYHFPKKEVLVKDLYFDMVTALQQISAELHTNKPNLEQILAAPASTFDVSLKYLFLYKDYVDIIRNFPDVAKAANESNAARKKGFIGLLRLLVDDGILSGNLKNTDLEYLIELSGAMRTFFFLQLELNAFDRPNLKYEYVDYVNRLLYPYLSPRGQEIYHLAENEWRQTLDQGKGI